MAELIPIEYDNDVVPTVVKKRTIYNPTTGEEAFASFDAWAASPLETPKQASIIERVADSTRYSRGGPQYEPNRFVTLVKMKDGSSQPFYISTGAGGKVETKVGKWYPFFGSDENGWFRKTSGKNLANYYGSDELRQAAQELDSKVGNLIDPKVRQNLGYEIPRAYESPRMRDSINRGMPTASKEQIQDLGLKPITDYIDKRYATSAKPPVTAPPIPAPTGPPPIPKGNTVQIPYTSKVADTTKKVGGFVGGAFAKTGPALGAVGTGVQVYQQFNALNEKNLYDREFGASDPFALRPFIDNALHNTKLGGRSFVDTVNDPEWVQRNPIAAAPYNLMAGNPEYARAFINSYFPSWMKMSERKETPPTYNPQFLKSDF